MRLPPLPPDIQLSCTLDPVVITTPSVGAAGGAASHTTKQTVAGHRLRQKTTEKQKKTRSRWHVGRKMTPPGRQMKTYFLCKYTRTHGPADDSKTYCALVPSVGWSEA